jgi:3-oxoacyl-[acyl-carrier-protein] synthase-3
VRIIGLGSALPSLTVTNNDLATFLDTSDEWILTRTGITQRRLLSDERIEDLAAAAAKQALAQAGISAADIDYLLCCNTYSAWMTPGLGCIVSALLGSKSPSLDLNGACAGFVYALEVAQALLASGSYRRMLIICAESPSQMVNWADRATCVLFGDAAAAVVVDGEGADARFVLRNEPGLDFLYAHNSPGNSPYRTPRNLPSASPSGADTPDTDTPGADTPEPSGVQASGAQPNDLPPSGIQMNGQEVYRFAVSAATRDLGKLLEAEGYTTEDVSHFLLHQANLRIIEAVRSRFKQPRSKFPTNIESCGNTLSASIPLLLSELDQQGALARGNILAMSAFGAGLTTGACLMKW